MADSPFARVPHGAEEIKRYKDRIAELEFAQTGRPIATAPRTEPGGSPAGTVEVLALMLTDHPRGYGREVVWWEPSRGCWWFSGGYEVSPIRWWGLPAGMEP